MSAVLDDPSLTSDPKAAPIFRPMKESDLSKVLGIETQGYPFPWTLGIFSDCLRLGYLCWVLERDNQLIAYAILGVAAEECHILNLCVDPNEQGQGYGRQLLNKMLSIAKVQKAQTAFLEVRPTNVQAVSLYLSEGFNEVGVRKDYYPAEFGREDAIIYAKEL